MSSNVDDRLNWLATQYVLGELSDSERDGLELRLADDLSACEAVARASRLRLALSAAFADAAFADAVPESRSVRSSAEIMTAVTTGPTEAPGGRGSRTIGTFVAAAACLLLVTMLGLRISNDSATSGSRLAVHSDRVAVELVARWRADLKLADLETDDADDDLHDSFSDTAVPGWLLAGVSLEKRGTVDGRAEE